MSLDALKNQMEILSRQGKMKFKEGAKESDIKDFENRNNIKIPNGYKEWLMLSDGGDLFLPAGLQLYGVTQKPIIDVNAENRPSDRYIVIGALCFGDPILFEKDTERIVIYNHEDEKIEDGEVFSDFSSFIEKLAALLEVGD